MAPLTVLLDANALMMPFQFSLDLEKELGRVLGSYEAAVPSSVVHELERLADTSPAARAALKLADRFRLIEAEGPADEVLLTLARREDAAVLTNDRALRRRLQEEGRPVLYLREKTRLEASGFPPG